MRFPLQCKIQIPWGLFPETAQLHLRQAEQVGSLVAHDLQNAHLFWSGPKALSAEIRLAHDSSNLKLRIDATDDHHVVKDFKEVSWKSDSVQFAIALNPQKTPWKIGLFHENTEKSTFFIWSSPECFQAKQTARKLYLRSAERKDQTDGV